MLKFNRVAAVVLMCTLVTATFGAAIKIKAFDWVHADNLDGDGMAIANYHQGNNRTEITAAITDFLPNTNYMIAVEPGLSGAPVTTNAAGNANAHAFTTFDICLFGGQVDFVIWQDDNGDFIRQVDEERATGSTLCP